MGSILGIVGFLAGSPAGRLLSVGLIVMSAYAYGYYKGDQHGDKQCADAALRAQILRQKLEINLAREQTAASQKTAEELEQQNREAEGVINALREKLKQKPETVYVDGCLVPGGVPKPKPRPR